MPELFTRRKRLKHLACRKNNALQGPVAVASSEQVEPPNGPVVSDRFTLQWSLDRNTLSLAIDTDLPDTAEVIVSVGRVYYKAGNAEAYIHDYFQRKARISSWRTPRQIRINDEVWKNRLGEHQEELSKIAQDLAFDIDRVDDHIEVSAVVHVNQPDPIFGGRGNPNLTGSAVSRLSFNRAWKLVEAEHRIKLPLGGTPPTRQARSVAFDGLVVGETYRLLESTPLMGLGENQVSSLDFDETIEALVRTQNIPAGRIIRVVGVNNSREWMNPWYEVEIVGDDSEKGWGWINGTALIATGVIREGS